MSWVDSCIICSINISIEVISTPNTGKINISTINHYRLLSVENILSLSLSVQNAVSVIPDYHNNTIEQDKL